MTVAVGSTLAEGIDMVTARGPHGTTWTLGVAMMSFAALLALSSSSRIARTLERIVASLLVIGPAASV